MKHPSIPFPTMLDRVRELNNQARTTLNYGDPALVVTDEMSKLPANELSAILMAVRFYQIDRFDLSRGEARFGALKSHGHFVYWRIDYRDAADLTREATHIANPRLTARILTVGLAT